MTDLSYTVTFLEMTAPPTAPQKPAPTHRPLALVRAHEPPTRYFLYLYQAVGAAYEWTDMLDWPEAKLAEFVQHPKVELYTLLASGWPGGFYQLDFRQEGLCDLAYFGLTPELVGGRVGPWLLDQALREAWSRDVARVTVNTCTLDHPKALAMYQRAGFEPVRREERRRTTSP